MMDRPPRIEARRRTWRIHHPRAARVVALPGGYGRDEACAKLAIKHGVIASFSRALSKGLTTDMSDGAFDAALAAAIDAIHTASVVEHEPSRRRDRPVAAARALNSSAGRMSA
jgi:fructose-bisphosphate aldolase class 1